MADAIAFEKFVPGAGVMCEPDVKTHHQHAGGADDQRVYDERVEAPDLERAPAPRESIRERMNRNERRDEIGLPHDEAAERVGEEGVPERPRARSLEQRQIC